MSASPTPRDLATLLISGLSEDPPFSAFVLQLARQTGAGAAVMLIRGARDGEVLVRGETLPPDRPIVDLEKLLQLSLFPYRSLRPRRVYALDEWRSADDAGLRQRQEAGLSALGIGDLRCIRIPAPGGGPEAWIVLAADARGFSATAGAALLAIEPAVAAALAALAEGERWRSRARLAEAILARLGIEVFLREPAASDGGGSVRALAVAAPAIKPALGTGPEVVDVRRTALPLDAAAAANVVAAELGLSRREAQLAVALADGLGLVEAGASLGLTPETTRNYSKRIYAKTGSKGQADIVRKVLTGLAPLARAG